MTTLSTNPVKGMRDLVGKPARVKRKIETLIAERAARYGFDPMYVPVLENWSVLTAKGGSGEEAAKELFTLEDQSGRKLGMRFEFTTSLARVVAGNPDLVKPIKSLNMGSVYRYDNPQALRYREFTQADCDILGVAGETADAELLALAVDVMDALGFTEYFIRLNDRRLINSLLALCEIPAEKTKDAMRALDKMDKIGLEGVKTELEKQNLPTSVLAYLNASLPQIKKELQKANLDLKGVDALERIMGILDLQKKSAFVKFDPSLVRGLDYYTGPVFEIFGGAKVSVGGGGRYDNLIKDLGGPSLPAVGISFGVDRLMDLLVDKWTLPGVEIYLIPIGKTQEESQRLASQLRDAGLRVEIDLMNRNIGKNMGVADARGVPLVLFLGEDELKANQVKIRDMKSGDEKMVKTSPAQNLVDEIQKILVKKTKK